MLRIISALAKCCSDGLGAQTEAAAALPGAPALAEPTWGRLVPALTSLCPSLTALQRPQHRCGVKGMD